MSLLFTFVDFLGVSCKNADTGVTVDLFKVYFAASILQCLYWAVIGRNRP